MKLPTNIEDKYLKEVLLNFSLEDLRDEEWKVIEGFDSYAISNYGRIKSLKRSVINSNGGEWKMPDRIMKLHVGKYYNKYVKKDFYSVRCRLSLEGKDYGKSVPRLVYYHFVGKFDMDDHKLLISFKDHNQFHVHSDNLEKLSVSEVHFKTMKEGRGKKRNFNRAVSQYTVEGNFVAFYESIDAAADSLGINRTYILGAIEKERLTVEGFRWFLKDQAPTKDDFMPLGKKKSDKIFNKALWKRLGQPEIDESNPPACMNLSLEDLPGEHWKPIPGIGDQFLISNKGRIKRLNTWTTQTKNTIFLKERIISLSANISSEKSFSLHTNLHYNRKKINIRINKLLYYCFVKEFDLSDRTIGVVNQSEPLWDIDITKLSLHSVYFFLKGKEAEKNVSTAQL
ncbi:NUMOD4 domain-containing protein [Chryseobacterium limigenitum]|uniref:NUMOD4 motif-containing protein n=1 Tax=Chryseobacterium limigenitum TaxID=1612149 RepID=A0A1K2IXS7_9FLAO|nr:NUMOD4 domain-containing protein [Chryseobacterium limigenitum]SFZ97078.1 NUMOD4 motif-containing protein [Chryseobacterium limigenitum]